MRNVLYIQHPWRHWRLRLAGIYRYAEKAGWRVQMVECGLTAMPLAPTLEFWKPDGCIVERSAMEVQKLRTASFGGIPTVFCDPGPDAKRRPLLAVEHDSSRTATVAARELLSLGFGHFAFVGNVIPCDWSDRRREVFAAAVASVGASFSAFAPGGADCISGFFARIRPWLRSLPVPCGILAANDISGDLVLQACRMEGLRVPEDIAVVGIDNDDLVCEHATPPLTSVAPDFEGSGYLAAELLDAAMDGRARPPCVRTFGATAVVRRNSTRKFRRRDDAVADAVEFIRRNACSGVSPAEVCRLIGGSRRQAECRFRAFAGRSIGEEIAAARVEHAKTLLLLREQPIESIAAECGYEDASSLRRAFRKATGLSPRAWRAGTGPRTGDAPLQTPQPALRAEP